MLDRNSRMRYAQNSAANSRRGGCGCGHGDLADEQSSAHSCGLCGTNKKPSCQGDQSRLDSKLLQALRKVDFSLIDVILYLDAYPDCAEAMKQYHQLRCEREKLLAQLAEAGYPISPQSVVKDFRHWTDGPWPWEFSANV